MLSVVSLLLAVVHGNNYIEISMSCDNGPNRAKVPFVVDANGASDGSVPIGAVNFLAKYEECTTEFLNDKISLDTFLSDHVLAQGGQQCADSLTCTDFTDAKWRSEINELAENVDVKSSKYTFVSIGEKEFTIKGIRELVLERKVCNEGGIQGFSCDEKIINDFDTTYQFNDDGQVVRVQTKTGDDLATKLTEWGLHHLGQYGFAKVNPVSHSIDNNPNSNYYNFVITQESVFYICIIGALLILSFTICIVSSYKYKYDNQVVKYSQISHLSGTDIN